MSIKLFSFRRCPYAIRARMTLLYSNINYQRIDVDLKNKPEELLTLSPKGTVPVLADNSFVLDESIDIMKWALAQSDTENWLPACQDAQKSIEGLIETNDNFFKQNLDRYKYPSRYFDHSSCHERSKLALSQCLIFLNELEVRLAHNKYLLGQSITLADIALFPFVRQFHHVNKDVLLNHNLKNTQIWLEDFLNSPLFLKTMQK